MLNKLLIIAVLTSASASTQTTILPTARTTLSMALLESDPAGLRQRAQALPDPGLLDALMGAVSIVWTVAILAISENALEDSLPAIGFPICFYYGFTGIACIFYYRHELTRSVRDFILLGLAPLLGGLILFGVFVKAVVYYSESENVSSPPILGITLPLWMGIGGLVLGVVLMLLSGSLPSRLRTHRPETVKPGLFEEPVERAPAHF